MVRTGCVLCRYIRVFPIHYAVDHCGPITNVAHLVTCVTVSHNMRYYLINRDLVTPTQHYEGQNTVCISHIISVQKYMSQDIVRK